MYRMTSRAAALAVAAVLLLPTRSSRAQPLSAASGQPAGAQTSTPQPATPAPASQPPAISDSDRDSAVRLLDQIRTLLEGTLEDKSGKSQKSGLKGAGTVQVPRATIDETLALVNQIRTMLKRAQP